MWVGSEQLQNAITHSLRVKEVKDVSTEWAVKKHDYAQPKSWRCEYRVTS